MMKRFVRVSVLLIGLVFLWGQASAFIPERRPSNGSHDFGWFLAPTPVNIEGVGSAIPVFGLLANIYDSADLIGVQTLPGGDMNMNILMFNELPLMSDHLQLTGGNFNLEAAVNLYNRGINSDPEDYVVPFFEQHAKFLDLRYLEWEQRIELFYRVFQGRSKQLKVLDPEGNLLSETVREFEYDANQYGFQFDFTDDNLDPRKGVRFGSKFQPQISSNPFTSDIMLVDSEVSLYFPMNKTDTLVWNFFASRSSIIREGVTDEGTARAVLNQGCTLGSPEYFACMAAEDKLVADALAYNKYGSTQLGGPDRLRAYDMGRFTAGNANFMGLEYRWNFTDKPKPINWYLIGGVNTLLQVAFFYEMGSVADEVSDLTKAYKRSYGTGFRALISGFVYRLDLAMGDEGAAVTLFIDYPMQLLPVAN